jgi:hypothetical protein
MGGFVYKLGHEQKFSNYAYISILASNPMSLIIWSALLAQLMLIGTNERQYQGTA